MAAPPQVSVKQTAKGNTIVGSTCSSSSITTTTGNMLVALIETASSGTNSCTGVKDANGTAFTQIGSPVANGVNQLQIFYLQNIVGATGAIQATWASAPALPIVFVWEVQNADQTVPYLVEATGTAPTTNTVSTNTFSTTQDCIVLIGGCVGQVNSPPFTEITNGIGILFDDVSLLVTGNTGSVGCAGHSFFSGSNSGLQFGISNAGSGNMSILAVAFKAAANMGVKLNVVCQGDSITSGYGVTTPWTSSLILDLTSQVFNEGVPSETLATMVSNAASVVDTKLRTNMTNVSVIWGGTNDLVLGSSVATVEGLLTTYAAARKTATYNFVISVEMLDRGDADVHIQKNAYNAFLVGPPLPTSIDATTVLPATLIADGASSNLTYFQPLGVHPTQFSDTTIIAPDISAAINGLLPWSIGGNTGVGGVTISYSGAASGSVTSDGSGNYTIANLLDGSYTLTPSKIGYTFSPTSANETVSGANITGVNFTAIANPTSSGYSSTSGLQYSNMLNWLRQI
jgi:hypothetical protein